MRGEEWRQLFLAELFDTDGDVMLQDEIKGELLFGGAGIRGADFAGEGRLGVGDVGQDVVQVALLLR